MFSDRQTQYAPHQTAALLQEAIDYAEERGENEPFAINNDSKADWALRKIASNRAETDRIIALASEQIEEMQAKLSALRQRVKDEGDRYQRKTAYLREQLEIYFSTVPHKKTKTTEKYRLLSGDLVLKRGGTDYPRDDQKIIDWARAAGRTDFIKTTDELRWAELKKYICEVEDGFAFIDPATGEVEMDPTTGEVKLIPSLSVTQKPDTFMIDFGKAGAP
jgi:hypothetical protein